tara:strand:+ start:5801 stop:6295 length:495 start_codon:yes stop_codon:yes gene_type:complete
MYKEKTYNGTLNIEKNKVSIDTNFEYKSITIHYLGRLKIKSLLPKGYKIINNKKTKTLVIFKNYHSKNYSIDLFSYFGYARLLQCKVKGGYNYFNNLHINNTNLEFWETLNISKEKTQDWAYITRNWEDLSFDGKNNKKSYLHTTTTYDQEKNQATTIKEIRKK